MADFRDLALQYVLTDDAARQKTLAKEAASALKTSERTSNPVARWVESIQPWISTGDDDNADSGVDGEAEATGDLVARSKAMTFLADTLAELDQDFLKPNQVALLIAYFGSIFKIDVKRGIHPASRALSHVSLQKAFKPPQADEILTSISSLGDDFKNQVAETRSAVYDLVLSLITRSEIANDLQYRHGATAGFITDLLQLCRNERDPKCLMTWFRILSHFLSDYDTAPEVVQEIFNTFSAYFPISLRTSQHPSGITKDELKAALRGCFSAHQRVAQLAIPYLLGRLDHGDSITVNIKLDILSTLSACINQYERIEQSVVPYVDKIWTSLKYEVRNGEVEDTITGTLEVIRTLAKRLDGSDLRDYALTIQRDCLDDLANPMYTAAAGKLLLSIHSAKPSAFALMVTPSITHIKDNLRHTKSSNHTRDLLVLLNGLLELRSVFMKLDELKGDDAKAFEVTESAFVSLYRESYMLPFHQATNPGADKDVMGIGNEAVKGLGLLISQRTAQPGAGDTLMLDDQAVSSITSDLAQFLVDSNTDNYEQTDDLADLVSQTTLALRRATVAHSPTYRSVLDRCIATTDRFDSPTDLQLSLQHLLPRAAFIGCSEIAESGDKAQSFVLFLTVLLKRLKESMDSGLSPVIWCEYASGIQAAVRHFKDACEAYAERSSTSDAAGKEKMASTADTRFEHGKWINYISTRFPDIPDLGNDSTTKLANAPERDKTDVVMSEETSQFTNSGDQLFVDLLLVTLLVTRNLYRRATKVVRSRSDNELSLELSDDFKAQDTAEQAAEDHYLCLIADLAKFAVGQMNSQQQQDLLLAQEIITLFHGDDVIPDDGSISTSGTRTKELILRSPSEEFIAALNDEKLLSKAPVLSIGGFGQNRAIFLSLGLFVPLQPVPMTATTAGSDGPFAGWMEKYIPHQMVIAGMLSRSLVTQPRAQASLYAMLTSLSNKFPIEKMGSVLDAARAQMDYVAAASSDVSEQGLGNASVQATVARSVFALTAGGLRRYKGSFLKSIIQSIVQAPSNPVMGHVAARSIEILFHEHECLRKEYHANINPLWRQRAYFEVVKPMLSKAWPAGSNSKDDTMIAANYSIAVLAAVKALDFGIYEADTEDLIRLILCVIRRLPAGPDVEAGFEVLVEISRNASNKLTPFLKSVLESSISTLQGQSQDLGAAESWVPEDFVHPQLSRKSEGKCRLLSLMLLQEMPRQQEQRHLLDVAPNVRRALARASGDRLREVRRAALAARAAWAELN